MLISPGDPTSLPKRLVTVMSLCHEPECEIDSYGTPKVIKKITANVERNYNRGIAFLDGSNNTHLIPHILASSYKLHLPQLRNNTHLIPHILASSYKLHLPQLRNNTHLISHILASSYKLHLPQLWIPFPLRHIQTPE